MYLRDMIVYNVTVSIDPTIEKDWLEWMRSTHIPDVMATGCFKESRILRVHGEEQGGLSYAITYISPDQETYDRYASMHAPKLQQEHNEKYAGRFAAFRTMLTLIDEFTHER